MSDDDCGGCWVLQQYPNAHMYEDKPDGAPRFDISTLSDEEYAEFVRQTDQFAAQRLKKLQQGKVLAVDQQQRTAE